MYSSNNSPNTPTFSPRTAAEPARMGCEGEGALHLRILASFARGVRACLRRLGFAGRYLRTVSVRSFRVTAAWGLDEQASGVQLTAYLDVGDGGKSLKMRLAWS